MAQKENNNRRTKPVSPSVRGRTVAGETADGGRWERMWDT